MRPSTFFTRACLLALVLLAVGASAAPAAAPDATKVALDYVKKNKAALGLVGSDVNDVVVQSQVVSAHTGVTHVYLQQQYKGIDVYGAILNVNVLGDGSVLNVGNRFVANLADSAGGQSAKRSAVDAVGAAAKDLGLKPKELRSLRDESGAARETAVSAGGISTAAIPAKLVFQPVDGGVRLAWNVHIYETGGDHSWDVNVDAATGEVLSSTDWVTHDDAHATALATATERPLSALVLPPAAVVDGSSYNVFPIPVESPQHGARSLVQNPADALASPFGWHDTNGAAGPEFTITRGNNVWAGLDVDNNNVTDPGSSPDGGAGLDFDYPLDLSQEPTSYQPAVVTNLFYWNNVVHDVLYRYGFDEASGNFQTNNYGRGGVGGDAVVADGQDGSGKNNANFSTTFPDGANAPSPPRMQMFRFRSSAPNPLAITAGSLAGQTFYGPMGGFGPSLLETGPRSADIVFVGRACSPAYQAGQPLDPLLADPAGKIALTERGSCTFVAKVKRLQDAGAIAVIVINNAPGPASTMGGTDNTITIPSIMLSQADGTTVRNALPLTATLSDGTGGVPERDSDIDNGIIAHEYGHGLSHRLTGGPMKTINCLPSSGAATVFEQMGEGWSDLVALFMTATPADTATTLRGMGTYTAFHAVNGLGIRPTQYTTDMAVNPSTYDTIKNEVAITAPHGVGYVWASMVWEVYWNLVDKYGFNPNIYGAWDTGGNNLAFQLMVDGLKLQPCRPGFVDGRNAILAADVALTGGENQCEIWRGFAKRGLGFDAVQGTAVSRTDNTQGFALPATCTATFGGFTSPVENVPAVNDVNAGSTVPLKFALSGAGGATPRIDSQQVDCSTLVTSNGLVSPIEQPGSSSITIDGDEYHANWKTDDAWEGTCRKVTVRLAGPSDGIAYFRFN